MLFSSMRAHQNSLWQSKSQTYHGDSNVSHRAKGATFQSVSHSLTLSLRTHWGLRARLLKAWSLKSTPWPTRNSQLSLKNEGGQITPSKSMASQNSDARTMALEILSQQYKGGTLHLPLQTLKPQSDPVAPRALDLLLQNQSFSNLTLSGTLPKCHHWSRGHETLHAWDIYVCARK